MGRARAADVVDPAKLTPPGLGARVTLAPTLLPPLLADSPPPPLGNPLWLGLGASELGCTLTLAFAVEDDCPLMALTFDGPTPTVEEGAERVEGGADEYPGRGP